MVFEECLHVIIQYGLFIGRQEKFYVGHAANDNREPKIRSIYFPSAPPQPQHVAFKYRSILVSGLANVSFVKCGFRIAKNFVFDSAATVRNHRDQ